MRNSHNFQGANSPAAFIKVYSLPIQNYVIYKGRCMPVRTRNSSVHALAKQAMYIHEQHTEARSANHCCRRKKGIFCVCVYSRRYTTWNAHAPYCIVVSSLPGCTIFFHVYLINGTIFEKEKLIKHDFIFSTTFVLSISF
jgi:hypothetical protein